MQPKKFRWSRVYESSEEELQHFLSSRQKPSERWHAPAAEEVAAAAHSRAVTLWCAEGSLNVTIDAQNYSLQPGDALTVPANLTYDVRAGISGCVCYQSIA